MDIRFPVTLTRVPSFAGALLARVFPWRKIRFRNTPVVVHIVDILLWPFMKFGAEGKITHWWDWTPVPRAAIDPEVSPLVLASRAPQQRIYRRTRWLGQYNLQGLRDLYLTLFVLRKVVILEPEWYQGFWRLLIAGNRYQDENQYEIFDQVDVLVRGRAKTLLDGKKMFLGHAEDGRYIPLKLVAITSRNKYAGTPFV